MVTKIQTGHCIARKSIESEENFKPTVANTNKNNNGKNHPSSRNNIQIVLYTSGPTSGWSEFNLSNSSILKVHLTSSSVGDLLPSGIYRKGKQEIVSGI